MDNKNAAPERIDVYRNRLEELANITKLQCSEPTVTTDAYMCGLSNGLMLARATMEDDVEFEPFKLMQPVASESDEAVAMQMAMDCSTNEDPEHVAKRFAAILARYRQAAPYGAEGLRAIFWQWLEDTTTLAKGDGTLPQGDYEMFPDLEGLLKRLAQSPTIQAGDNAIYDESGLPLGPVQPHPIECDHLDRPAEIIADCEMIFRLLSPGFRGHLSNVLGYVQHLERQLANSFSKATDGIWTAAEAELMPREGVAFRANAAARVRNP